MRTGNLTGLEIDDLSNSDIQVLVERSGTEQVRSTLPSDYRVKFKVYQERGVYLTGLRIRSFAHLLISLVSDLLRLLKTNERP